MGSSAAATQAATLFVATMLLVTMALLPLPSSSDATGLRHGELKKGLRHKDWEEGVLDGEHQRALLRQRSLAGEEVDGSGDAAGVVAPLLPLASAKRQVPTGADPIHHNERPPSLPHRRFP